MKFGGSSVADTDKIKHVARVLVAAREAGNRVVGVLSAMGDTTDGLIQLAHEISARPHPREYDMLISTGERISNALCAMAIQDLGHEAVSLTGSQAGIVTDTSHTKAKIVDIRAQRIHEALAQERIVLVAGFQGVSTTTHDVTTLGRGGSDTTAVALASALGAGACELVKETGGVLTADPKLVPDAERIPAASHRFLSELASAGARVIHHPAAAWAEREALPLRFTALTETEGSTEVTSTTHSSRWAVTLRAGRSRFSAPLGR